MMSEKSALCEKNYEFAARAIQWGSLPVFDARRLESLSSGDRQFASDVRQAYFNLLPEVLDLIQTAIAEGNGYALRYHAHSAKGSSQAVGADRLAAILHVLEKELDLVDAELVLPILKDEARQVQLRLQALEAA